MRSRWSRTSLSAVVLSGDVASLEDPSEVVPYAIHYKKPQTAVVDGGGPAAQRMLDLIDQVPKHFPNNAMELPRGADGAPSYGDSNTCLPLGLGRSLKATWIPLRAEPLAGQLVTLIMELPVRTGWPAYRRTDHQHCSEK